MAVISFTSRYNSDVSLGIPRQKKVILGIQILQIGQTQLQESIPDTIPPLRKYKSEYVQT